MKWHFGKGPCIGGVLILYLLGCVGEAAHIWETKYPGVRMLQCFEEDRVSGCAEL